MSELHPCPWTYETEFVSQERVQKTGAYFIADGNGKYVCKVGCEVMAKRICALPDMIDAVNQLLEDAVKLNRQEHRVTNYSINLARAAIVRS